MRKKKFGWAWLLGVSLLLLPLAGRAVEISEVCPDNVTAYMTAAGDYPDWIELYNPEKEAVELSDTGSPMISSSLKCSG